MKKLLVILLLCMSLCITGCKNGKLDIDTSSINEFIDSLSTTDSGSSSTSNTATVEPSSYTDGLRFICYGYEITIPDYVDCPYCEVNNNKPFFTKEEVIDQYYESYSGLDDLGRCQTAMACLSKETMPEEGEKREDIGSIKPAGWHTAKYPGVVNGNYLYNRCHLIGWQLSAENANPLNLTTGTRYLNVDGMLPFENKVDNYIEKHPTNHVMYRITPVYVGNELVCRGLMMEAQSVEDNGCVFCIYCYNVQPGIDIDYLTGESKLSGTNVTPTKEAAKETNEYVINKKTGKIHKPTCSSIADIEDKNIEGYKGKLQDLLDQGYTACKKCKPE